MKRMNKKIAAAIASVMCFMALSMPVLAYDQYYSYAIGPSESKQIASFVPGASTIYFNSRPVNGGDLTVSLSGAASGSAIFPYYTSRSDWKVTGVNASRTLIVKGSAGSKGSSGSLHSWSK